MSDQGWPKVGDLAYYKGENWGADGPDPSVAELEAQLKAVILKDQDGRLVCLGVTDLVSDVLVGGDRKVKMAEFDANDWFPSLSAALRAAANDEQAYSDKCLAVAASLRKLADEAEGAAR